MEGKKVNVYYKGVKQTIKVFDNTSESDFLEFIKKIFHLNSDKSKIFLQDEEGNFLNLYITKNNSRRTKYSFIYRARICSKKSNSKYR